MRNVVAIIVVLLYSQAGFSQNTIGIPAIINHSKEDYHAGNQNWDVRQDADGILYFANNEGLLTYDGTVWHLYPLPNHVIARSVAIGPGHRIYVGGQEEFGYFSPGRRGDLVYTSLKNRIPEKDHDFADVWDICMYGQEVFFRSKKKIFKLQDDSITEYHSTDWGCLGSTQAGIIAYEFTKGLVAYRNGDWVPVIKTGSLPPHAEIRSLIDIGRDSLLIGTFTHGLYILHNGALSKFESPALEGIAASDISGAALLEPDRLAIITNLAGCIIVNLRGEEIRRFSKKEGLQNDNIQALLLDKDDNLWLALDNGIDMITYHNAITTIFPEKEDRNAGYTSLIYRRHLYLGGSTGLFSIALDSSRDLSRIKGSFDFVENTRGQVWSLTEINGKLLVGHTKGALTVENNKGTFFDDATGFWTFLPFKGSPAPLIIAGTYNGINIYQYDGKAFINPKVHAQFESAKFVAIDDSLIWVAHSYKGLYKVVFDGIHPPTSSVYKDTRGILSPNHNHLFAFRDTILLTTDKGLFEYDRQKRDFIRSPWLTTLFKGIVVSYLKEDPYGNIWFAGDKKLGVVDRSSGSPRIVAIPELDDRIMAGGYENINIIDSNNVIVAAEKGFFHIDYARYVKTHQPVRVLIRNVVSSDGNNDLLFGGYTIGPTIPVPDPIKYQGNSLHFEFSAAYYAQQPNIDYSYYLRGFDKGWSVWSRRTDRDYTNLPAGDYTFLVKARNTPGNISAASSYSFTILPPLYRTWWAYGLYVLLFFGLLYVFYKRQQGKYQRLQRIKLKEQQRQYNEEQQRLRFLHQIEVEKNEKEIIHLTNAKLQGEIEHKNKELASNAMIFVQKGELLSKIKDELTRLKNNAELEKDSKDFKKIIRIIDSELDNPQDWEQFAVHFDSVHTNYLKNLKERYPELTPSELKLCAYLRMNLSTKEISQLMNISIRGVETSRYRLRKKLQLSNEANLVDFLLTING